MYYYVYLLEHIETGEFYIGSRQCKVHPSIDSYLGSMSTWKPDKNKLKKTIIKSDFNDRKEATIFEREEIIKNIKNLLNQNHHIPGIGYHMSGLVVSKDKNGNIYTVEADDDRLKTGELVGINKGFITVKDSNGKTKRVLKTDPDYISGKFQSVVCNEVVVIDKNGKRFRISKDDPMFLSGEVVPFNRGIKLVLNKRLEENHSSKFTQVGNKNSQYGTCWIHSLEGEGENKKVKKEELSNWLSKGWLKGAKFKK